MKKSDGVRQRLIVDARRSNACFSVPPPPDLPTGASYSRVFLRPGEKLSVTSSDLKDAFYTIELPRCLRRFFTLAPVRAEEVGLSHLEGRALSPKDWVFPRLSVIPMGWSHAVNFCQRVVRSAALRVSGTRPEMFVSDLRPFPGLKEGSIVIYVDNVVCLSTDEALCRTLQESVNVELRRVGLCVHEESVGEASVATLGWEFRTEEGIVVPKGRRAWRLVLACQDLLDRRVCSGRQLGRLVGHFVSLGLLRRESLCCLSAVYAFQQKYDLVSCELWPSVLREVRWLKSLVPFLVHEYALPVRSMVLTCDASHWGKDAVHAHVSEPDIVEVCRYNERWRFRANEGQSCARAAPCRICSELSIPLWRTLSVCRSASIECRTSSFVWVITTVESLLFLVQTGVRCTSVVGREQSTSQRSSAGRSCGACVIFRRLGM